ncbi:hypothetical protein CP532_2831 [Ophiocordyceps camponoti-leonardi (nom. inval.)]|nr:hypothetical protein CP532_2831 [Ophiocordyceps camponoti-leonardi (nom. inval.)]
MSTASPPSGLDGLGLGLDDRVMIRRLLSKYSRRDIDRLLEEESVGGGESSDYACGFCAEIGITKTCTRRNDLRRHIDQFHNTNAIWLCQHPGCPMAFDWQTAYQLHLRNQHGGSQMRMEEAKVSLCPQTVFACGYRGCHHLVEASSDAGASAAWRAYTAHLIKHCDEGGGGGRRSSRGGGAAAAAGWDYSHRMRNLLGQPRVAAAWKAAVAAVWLPGDASSIKHEMRQAAHLLVDGSGNGGIRSVMPFRSLDGFVDATVVNKAHPHPPPPIPPLQSSPPLRSSPPTATAAVALYGMLGTTAAAAATTVFHNHHQHQHQQQLVSFRQRPLVESETSDDGSGGGGGGCCRWDDVYYGPVTVTGGGYYDLAAATAAAAAAAASSSTTASTAGPVMTAGQDDTVAAAAALLGAYGPSSTTI